MNLNLNLNLTANSYGQQVKWTSFVNKYWISNHFNNDQSVSSTRTDIGTICTWLIGWLIYLFTDHLYAQISWSGSSIKYDSLYTSAKVHFKDINN